MKKSVGFVSSFVFHGILFMTGGVLFARPIEYAVQQGMGGVEIYLTAAPAEAVIDTPVIEKKEAPKPEELPAMHDPDDRTLPQFDVEEQKIEAPVKKEEKKDVLTAVKSEVVGDGSSAVPGKDVTTFYSAGGAVTLAQPNYLRNPAPSYPWEARQKGWEGVVVLKVMVDKSGRAMKVEQEKSSGYAVLDNSASKTVKSWRFRPAQLGTLPVDSLVRVPIRFELEGLSRQKI